jgi:serine/threonine protein kinase
MFAGHCDRIMSSVTLVSGAKLGPYAITILLGAGGMGEVWKAHDTRLGGDVAIKISDEHFSPLLEDSLP